MNRATWTRVLDLIWPDYLLALLLLSIEHGRITHGMAKRIYVERIDLICRVAGIAPGIDWRLSTPINRDS